MSIQPVPMNTVYELRFRIKATSDKEEEVVATFEKLYGLAQSVESDLLFEISPVLKAQVFSGEDLIEEGSISV